MGTRHLICAKVDGEYKVAQYGQWDGYPSGLGTTILDFLRNADMKKFKKAIASTKFANKEQIEEINAMTSFPQEFSRDTGGEILGMILNEGVRLVHDSSSFINDSLFCEWAYVVNLDDDTLEVYKGFNTTPLKKTERFYNEKANDGGYYPCKLVGKVDLNKLPTDATFIKKFEKE